MKKNEFNEEPIAIVGLASLFPESPNLQQYWENIVNKKDCISEVPKSHWDIDDFYDPDPSAQDKTYCKRGGFIPTTEFNPMEFGIPPNSLDVIDILQLLSLTVAKAALHNAGYLTDEKDRSKTGVVLGITGANSLVTPLTSRLQSPVWKKVLLSRGLSEAEAEDIIDTVNKSYAPWEEQSFPGMLGNVIAGRVANRFDFGATNCTIDAACASSLAALRMAVDELRSGRADMMLTGGCDAENTILMYMCFSKTPAFSKKGIIRPFDINSDGTLIGEGIGMYVLKRLSDAERDNDIIYGVLRGLGSSSDGRYKSIYAPREQGQIACLQRAYEDAGISPETVGLIEAHGTGTKVGDATEVSALKTFLSEFDTTDADIALSSVKSQIGHTKAAAGAASIVKTTLALYHKVLPASINIDNPNPALALDDSPLYINSETRPWFLNPGQDKRRAGVSSFGFGGTNFHAVLEEYNPDIRSVHRLHRHGLPVLISADSFSQLEQQLDNILAGNISQLKSAFSTEKGQYKLGFTGTDSNDVLMLAQLAKQQLSKLENQTYWHHPKGIFFASSKVNKGKLAALFSGQGSQYVNMSRQAAINFPQYIEMFELAEKEVLKRTNQSLTAKVFPNPVYSEQALQEQERALTETAFAQPAIGCVSSAAYSVLTEAGFSPDCVAGHSFGELTAVWASGAISKEDYFALAAARGHAMTAPKEQTDSGTMVAVKVDETALKQLILDSTCSGIYLCNFNTNKQTVIGGSTSEINTFVQFLESKGVPFNRLQVSGAFHTPLVAHSQSAFAKDVDAVKFAKPSIALYRNKDAKKVETASTLKQGLKKQLLEPVKFKNIIEQMYEDGVRTFVEFGPKGALTSMVNSILADAAEPVYFISSDAIGDNTAVPIANMLVQLAVLGFPMSSLDHYYNDYQEAQVKPGHAITLNGINYISDKRKQSYQDALNNPPAKKQEVIDIYSKKVNSPVGEYTKLEDIKDDNLAVMPVEEAYTQPPTGAKTIMKSMSLNESQDNNKPSTDIFELIKQQQSSNSVLHEGFMNHAVNNIEQTLNTIQSVNETCRQSPEMADCLTLMTSKALDVVNEGRQVTTQAHENYMAFNTQLLNVLLPSHSAINQSDLNRLTDNRSRVETAPIKAKKSLVAVENKVTNSDSEVFDSKDNVSSMPGEFSAVAENVASTNVAEQEVVKPLVNNNIIEQMLAIVAEKTGYPADVIDPDMDIEADLGIDSIKRVEILAAIKDSIPNVASVDHDKIGELKTIGDLAAAFTGHSVSDNQAAAENKQNAGAMITSAPTTNNSAATYSSEQISSLFLSIVSEKTGYPEDVLTLDMDMESDLGIDSIKRVEILSAIQSQIQSLGDINADALVQMRTLKDIVDWISEKAQSTPNITAGMQPTLSVDIAKQPSLNEQQISNIFLTIIGDKTGYPVDVLEKSMSLEADLGIDSIKRVEILAELQKQLKFENAFDPEKMLGLTTLGHIIDFIKQEVTQNTTDETSAVNIVSTENTNVELVNSIDVARIEQELLAVVSEKTGYPIDVIELNVDLESDLGVDSIKRVEILGALQARFPELAVPNPEHLGELRSLEQIVAKFSELNQGATEQASPHPMESLSASLQSISNFSIVPAAIKPADPLLNAYGEKPVALVVAESSEQSVELIKQLQAKNFTINVICFPGLEFDASGVQVQRLKDWDEKTLNTALSSFSTIDLVIYQHDSINVTKVSDYATQQIEIQWLQHLLLLAKYYKTALNDNVEVRKGFVTVARIDGQLGLKTPESRCLAAGCFGLIKTLAVESQNIFCRALDIEPSLSAKVTAQRVLEEAFDHKVSHTDIAWSAEQRYSFTLGEHLSQQQDFSLSDETCFIVTGGARGITASCIKALAARQPGKYLLLGRTTFDVEQVSWAQGVQEQNLKQAAANYLKNNGQKVTPKLISSIVNDVIAWREINDTLTTLSALNVQVRYQALDIADREQVEQWSKKDLWLSESPQWALIHGAGALSDRFIEDKNIQEMEKVFSGKIIGASNLIGCLNSEKLTLACLFSSVAGLFGNNGQVDYAMANEILNRMTIALQNDMIAGGRALAIIWGAWNAGMVTPSLKAMFESRGIPLIELAHGVEQFANICLQPSQSALTMVGPSSGLSTRQYDLQSFTGRKWQVSRSTEFLLTNDLLKDHSINNDVVLPATFAFGWIANAVEGLLPGFVVSACQEFEVKKGLIVNDEMPKAFVFDISVETASDAQHLVLNATVYDPQNKRVFYSCKGMSVTLTATNKKSTYSIPTSFSEQQLEIYSDGTLFHGERFQLIRAFHIEDKDEIVFSCYWVNDEGNQLLADHSATDYCPLNADALLQAALVWVRKYENISSLPVAIRNLKCYQAIKPEEVFHVRVQIIEQSSSNSVLQLIAQTHAGEVFLELEANVIKSHALEDKFQTA